MKPSFRHGFKVIGAVDLVTKFLAGWTIGKCPIADASNASSAPANEEEEEVLESTSSELYSGLSATSCSILLSVKPYLNAGRHIYSDRGFTSVELASWLQEHNTYITGTTRSSRKGASKGLVKKKNKNPCRHVATAVEIGKSGEAADEMRIVYMVWKDVKDVHLLTTSYGTQLDTTPARRQKRAQIINVPHPLAIA